MCACLVTHAIVPRAGAAAHIGERGAANFRRRSRPPRDDGAVDGPFTSGVGDQWRAWRRVVDLDEYDGRWDRLAATGDDVHGEAAAVERLGGGRVLDAGCGMGRVAIELDRRGHDVVGVDADADLLERARRRAPDLTWIHADLSRLDLGQRFDVIVLAGDVLHFVAPDRRAACVVAVARHLAAGAVAVIGGWTGGEVSASDLDRWIRAAGCEVRHRWSTWDGDPADNHSSYRVVVIGRATGGVPAQPDEEGVR